jgi:hypothetical protein
MMDASITKFIQKNPQAKNVRVLAKLFMYRQPVTNCIAKYLEILGLDKLPDKPKSLEDIFSEKSHDAPDTESDSKTD